MENLEHASNEINLCFKIEDKFIFNKRENFTLSPEILSYSSTTPHISKLSLNYHFL